MNLGEPWVGEQDLRNCEVRIAVGEDLKGREIGQESQIPLFHLKTIGVAKDVKIHRWG